MTFDEQDKILLKRFIEKLNSSNVNGLMALSDLWNITDKPSKLLIKKILDLDPHKYGFKGEEIDTEGEGINLIKINNSSLISQDEYSLDQNSYLPEHIMDRFNAMNIQFQNDFQDRQLLIGSGYRSPAFQIITLLFILVKFYKFDINETLKRVALPKYSEHCSIKNTALDILNIDGLPNDENPTEFAKTVEFNWLINNARNFGFKESYPKDNNLGIMWEPWHWRFID